ncbi:phosphatase [Teredinibacter turnerae]|uniref:phosphatase n=1 Tax=Teredinibacter turnerae TaxID=2426 RepID=UPI00037439D6|nr:phosphatase [Teredinibacter turnerae]
MKTVVDTHAHTIASTHAYSTVHDYVTAAKQRGLDMFTITDHAPAMPDSPHFWHFGNMKIFPRIESGIAILRGIEANILPDGEFTIGGISQLQTLDIPPGLVPFLDLAVASFHEPVFAPADEKTHTHAMIKAIRSGLCQIVGHPGNPNYPINQEEVIRAARDNNVLLEINNSSFTHSRSGSEKHCMRLLELVDTLDWKVVFASDAHIAYDLGDHSSCIEKARQVGFPEERVVSVSAKRFVDFLGSHGKPVAKELEDWTQSLPEAA